MRRRIRGGETRRGRDDESATAGAERAPFFEETSPQEKSPGKKVSPTPFSPDHPLFDLEKGERTPPTPRARTRAPARGLFGAEQEAEVRRWIESREWGEPRPVHWVASFVVYHERVYGFRPPEAGTKQWWLRGAALAKRCLDVNFAGDVDKMIDFVWWLWKREYDREQWANQNGKRRRRLVPQLAFSPVVVGDYQYDLMRNDRRVRS